MMDGMTGRWDVSDGVRGAMSARRVLWLALLCAMVGYSGLAVAAEGPMERPTQRTKDCTAAGCHAAQTAFKVRHGPSAVGACDACHIYTDEQKHTFKLREEKGALCTFCHIGGGGPAGTVTHKPFADGECLGCHNPHGGSNRAVLRKDTMAELCASCHGDITKKKSHIHGPVAAGSCAACHAAHRSNFPKLLPAQGRDLCLSCHDQMNNQLQHVKIMHKPVAGECQQCHETHASDYAMQLKNKPAELCESCHDKIKELVVNSEHKHSATTTGAGCLNCHTPHGGDLAKLMKAEPINACLSCHDKPIQVSKTQTLVSMAVVKDPKQSPHGPIRQGECSGCHTPHGGPNAHLLAKPYADSFYQPFAIEKYDLCFTCHDKQLVLLEKAAGLTKFRNGEQNLHYLHVNKSDKGRNCRACHMTHASTLPVHLRETVLFGKWEMPIGYKQTANGGGCKPGCHEEYNYDRTKAVVNRPSIPTTQTAAK